MSDHCIYCGKPGTAVDTADPASRTVRDALVPVYVTDPAVWLSGGNPSGPSLACRDCTRTRVSS